MNKLILPIAAAALAAGLHCEAHAQGIGIFNNIIRQQMPAAPANLGLGNVLAPATGGRAGGDLIQMLVQSVDQIDEPREIEIGRQLAAVLLGSKPLHPDVALQRYVNQLGRWVSLQSTRPQLPWTFAVLDDPGVNAFAAPGGYVFVTKGLYSSGLDQGDEFDADRNGVALAARAGFEPYGLPSVLQQMRTAAPDNPLFSLSLRTHPAPQLRLDQLEQAMGSRLDAFAGKPAMPLSQRLAARRR